MLNQSDKSTQQSILEMEGPIQLLVDLLKRIDARLQQMPQKISQAVKKSVSQETQAISSEIRKTLILLEQDSQQSSSIYKEKEEMQVQEENQSSSSQNQRISKGVSQPQFGQTLLRPIKLVGTYFGQRGQIIQQENLFIDTSPFQLWYFRNVKVPYHISLVSRKLDTVNLIEEKYFQSLIEMISKLITQTNLLLNDFKAGPQERIQLMNVSSNLESFLLNAKNFVES